MSNNLKRLADELKEKKAQVSDLFRRRMPVYAGRLAKDHFQDNFRKGGFVNRGLHEWPQAKRRLSGSSSAAANYGTLLSSRNHLFSSIQYVPGDARVRVADEVKYAPVHQFGGVLNPSITPKMRRFAWAKYYEAGGGTKNTGNGPKSSRASISLGNSEADMWKGLALTQKTKLSIKVPARPFIGESAELTEKIQEKGDQELTKILNK